MQGSKMAQVTYDSRCCFFHPAITFLANQKRVQAGRIYQSEASRVGLLLFETPTGFVSTKIGITLVHLSNCFSICFYFAYCKFGRVKCVSWCMRTCVRCYSIGWKILFHLPLEGDTVLTFEQTVKVELYSMFLKHGGMLQKNSILVSDICSICYSLSSSMLQTQATTSLIDIWYFGWMTY